MAFFANLSNFKYCIANNEPCSHGKCRYFDSFREDIFRKGTYRNIWKYRFHLIYTF